MTNQCVTISSVLFLTIIASAAAQESERAYAPLPKYRVFGSLHSAQDAQAIANLMHRFST